MNKLVIVSDYGLDDAVALANILEWGGYKSLDIIAAAGNASADASFNNAAKLLENAGKSRLKNVRLVDTRSEPQPYAELPSIHGNDGMGDLFQNCPPPVETLSFGSYIKEYDGGVILSLGPCTLVRSLLERAEAKQLVIMGGLYKETPNYEGYEFNHKLDVEAFSFCVSRPHVVATLDTCRVPCFNFAGRRTAGVTLKQKLIDRAEVLAERRHPDNCYIYDYITSLFITEKGIFRTERVTDPWGNKLNMLRAVNPYREAEVF